MTCPVCQLPRSECAACGDACPTCHGDGEITRNPGWPDPQCAVPDVCPTCKGDGVYHPNLNERPETWTDKWLAHTRDDTAADLFDEAFDELLARQDRLAALAGQQMASDAQDAGHRHKGGSGSEAATRPDLHRAFPLAPRNDPSSGGRPGSPSSGPATSEDDLEEAA